MTAQSPSSNGEPRWDSAYHAPVLASEVVELLTPGVVPTTTPILDGTLGGGGHALALLKGGAARVLGIDRDPEALAAARARLRVYESDGRFVAHRGNYAALDDLPNLDGVRFGGIVLDLGVSSHQIDELRRGFTFREAAPLDMRMGGTEDGRTTATAADLLNALPEQELAAIFREYGDEPRAIRLAREVVRRRETRPFAVADDLVDAIRGALGPRSGAPEFARLFQAVRIAVNDELTGLAAALPVLRDRLAPGAVMAVIAYHSGEDRLVKHAFREWSSECICPPRQPICTCRGRALGTLPMRRAITAGPAELARNARSRSARLRAFRAASVV